MRFGVGGLELTLVDLIGLAVAGLMAATLIGRARRNLRRLAQLEPAGGARA